MKNGNGPGGPKDCNDLMGEIGFQWFKLEDIYSLKNLPCENPFVSHRIQFFTLILLTEGKIRHDVDFISYTLDRGYCLFISPEQIHKFYKSNKGQGYVLSFTEDFIHRNFSRSSFSKINFLSNHFLNPSIFKDFGDIEIFMSALERELSLDLGIIKENLIASMLTVFLLKAQLYAEGSMKSYQGDFETFSKFQKLVSNYHKESRSVKHYANLLNISYKQLNNLSKAFTQRTAKEYINDYIILEIKRNLATTDFSIKQMAYEYGFKEGTNLTKFFKRATGDTPMKFKEIRLRNR